MKRKLLTLLLGFIALSCGKDVTIQESEAIRQEAFSSPEFKELKASFDEYDNYSLMITEIFAPSKTNKLSSKELKVLEENFAEEVAERFFVAQEKKKAFMEKYPELKTDMTYTELRNIIKSGVQ